MTLSYCSLTHSGGAEAFDVTDVGDAYTTMVTELDNLALDDSGIKGKRITGFIGSHAAGCSMVRVRNSVTNVVKMLECLDVVTEEVWRPVEIPFTVQEDDVLECFHVVVPT